ncbi:type II toxin-antitoxin system HipA family toxin [Thalassospira xianhensis]|uniref:type II toxin-antitoxin system HipA family toxin n=1 Tax=Thalassospira xianhensis TaxID=478503 RepID=UPI000DED87BB|nr:type II toxin-antitoxin system HipA family toxin [Thalassospira xianhensis]
MTQEASVRLHGIEIGTLGTDDKGGLRFRYSPDHIQRSATAQTVNPQLSLRLPVPTQAGENRWFDDAECGPFFAGLLPDNKLTRRKLALVLSKDHDIAADDEFAMLFALGKDCAGAVSIAPVGTVETPEDTTHPEYRILDEAELAGHIRDLPARPLFVDTQGEVRISLAGVHDKAVVIRTGEKIALPHGNTPSSHILKTDIQGLPESIRVEHYCLEIAREIGLPCPRSHILQAEDQIFMLVARYDRTLRERSGQRYLTRLHQEDFCQALGYFPHQKYERDGGPDWKKMFAALDFSLDPARDKLLLLRYAIFQYLVGNPDAHAKNYSLIWQSGGVRLAPLYDLNNAAAFRNFYKEQRILLAMSIGGERNPKLLGREHWESFASDINISPKLVIDELATLSKLTEKAATKLRQATRGTIADTSLLDLALEDIKSRCQSH